MSLYKKLSGIKRIPIKDYSVQGKKFLTEDEKKELLSGTVVIQEKIDGTERHKELEDFIIFYEDVRFCHTIHYTKLPTYELLFDIYDKKRKRFLSLDELGGLLEDRGVLWVPIESGDFRWTFAADCPVLDKISSANVNEAEERIVKILGSQSRFSDELIEGVVVKNYEKQLFGKVVRQEFFDKVQQSEHWRRKPKMNFLASGGKRVGW